jgi:ubiquinone/menaquinone biosynthesis C-methylase UbiE
MLGVLPPRQDYKGVITLYDTWHHHLLTDKTLFINYGYWKNANNLDDACISLAELVAETGQFSEKDVMLDVGFGFADQDIHWVRNHGVKKITGINITPSQVTEARNRVEAEGLSGVIDLREGSATEMPFHEPEFDKVVALECAFHFVNRDDFFHEAYRVLKPGGSLVAADIVAPRNYSFRDWLLMLYGHAQWQVPRQNIYDREEYVARLESAGFESVEINSISDHVWKPLSDFMKKRMASIEGKERIHPIHRNRMSRAIYVTSTCLLWPILKMDYVTVRACKPK